MGPLPNGRTSWLINGGDPITTYIHWDVSPSSIVNHQTGQSTHRSGAGCRSFDTASIYKNEAAVGRALQTFGGAEGAFDVILVI